MWSHNKGFGEWKNFTFTRHKFLLVTVKEWLKSVLNYRSYPKNKTGCPFFGPTCLLQESVKIETFSEVTKLLHGPGWA